jgi:hypothetical protein
MKATRIVEVAMSRVITYQSIEEDSVYVQVPEDCTDADVERFINDNEHRSPWHWIARPESPDCPGELMGVEVIDTLECPPDADEEVLVLERGDGGELVLVKPSNE